MSGASYGTPGGSLGEDEDTSWAANKAVAEVGRIGEQIVGNMLTDLVVASDGAVVLHDLSMPAHWSKANIDHIVITGSTVIIIDAKRWKPSAYYTLRSTAYRGLFSHFKHAQKNGMGHAADSIQSMLSKRNLYATISTPLVAVVPTGPGFMSTHFLRFPRAEVVSKKALATRVRRLIRDNGPADQGIVDALSSLLKDSSAYSTSTGTLPVSNQAPTIDAPVTPTSKVTNNVTFVAGGIAGDETNNDEEGRA
ncbi:nuclease-related domain-containing protein [Brevibacterium sp. FAM 24638]|uniref:nuclease-related domain-containing protein n=1 Tax=Brevibacterium sp. FAM 24638 TaxID=3415681 RepID=UPI003C7C9B5B